MRDQRGSATPLALLLCALIGVMAMGGVVIVGHWGAAHRAGHVADLAALAGAQAQADGGVACPVAERSARSNGADLRRCDSDGITVEVEVAVRASPNLPGLPAWAIGTAKAAPAP